MFDSVFLSLSTHSAGFRTRNPGGVVPGRVTGGWRRLGKDAGPLVALLSGLARAAGSETTALPGGAAVNPEVEVTTNPVFHIQRYELSGGPALEATQVERVTASGRGGAVHLSQIRRALRHLQEAYQEAGFRHVALTLPQQSLTDGVVRVQVSEGRNPGDPTPSIPVPAWQASTYDVRHFEVRGNTALTVEQLDQILGRAAGPAVGLDRLEETLGQLRAAYRERGYQGATVILPQQLITDGRVTIVVTEGRSPIAQRHAQQVDPKVPESKPKGSAPAAFEVRRYEVVGNTLLRADVIERAFTNATGVDVTFPRIQKALGELQLAYRERGYATVSVSLPPQQLTNAVVKVQVTEGILTELQVAGNRHFSSNNIRRSLPSLRTNVLLNSRVFQRELDVANQNRDRQIFPTLGPGPEPGTSALTLRVKDRLPLHGRLEVNNHATPGTPEWRINGSAQYNNLWQHDHQVGVSYGFTPEAYKQGDLVTDRLLNRPLVANYGAYYRMPFGRADSVEEQIASATRFGFDEATRQFRLPPAGARPDLSVFASASSSDTGVQLGAPRIVSQTPLLTIVSQDSGQNLSINESVGARLNIPFPLTDTNRWSISAGPDWKRFFLESFNTNNFVITTVVTNAQGSQVIESRVASPQPVRRTEVQYLPLTFAADYSQSDRWGSSSANLGLGGSFVGESTEFAAASYSTNAGATYGKASLSLTRDQRVFGDWSLLVRASGQIATGALISNEQFSLGGLNSVRGYFEGEQFGDAGWFSSVELRSPFLATRVPVGPDSRPLWLRGSGFLDYGQSYLLEAAAGRDASSDLCGAGFGLSANLNNILDLRITVAWPLLDSPIRRGREPRAYFSLGGQF